MRRRERAGVVPPLLAEFVPTEWPGRTVSDRFRIWKEARHCWFDANGWPGGPAVQIRVERGVRRRLGGAR